MTGAPSQVMMLAVLAAMWGAGGNKAVVIGAGACLLLARWVPWRYQPGRRLGEWLYFLIAIPFVVVALSQRHQSASELLMSHSFTLLATDYLLCLAIQELYRKPGPRQTLVVHMALLGVLFHAGMSYELKAYPAVVAVYIAAAVCWFLQSTQRGVPVPWSQRVRLLFPYLVAVSAAVSVAGSLFLYLPKAERQTTDLYTRIMFGTGLTLMGPLRDSELGSLTPMFGSSTIMARWEGPNPQYLRAHVMMTYGHNRWDPGKDWPLVSLVHATTRTPLMGDVPTYCFKDRVPKGDAVVGDLLQDRSEVLLAPYGTWAVQSSIGEVRSDPLGVIHGNHMGISLEMPLAWYPANPEDLTGKTADDPDYLDVPHEMRGEITDLAKVVTKGRHEPIGQCDAIMKWLQSNCSYVLSPPPGPESDRLETFLFRNHQGYCEYFATSMALLLRTLGVRTRYVLGYMVREKNSIGGYWVVRARDAHAWVEVYLPGKGWTTWDPTPPDELAAMAQSAASTAWFSQLLDQYGLWFTRFWALIHSGNWKQFLRSVLSWLRQVIVHEGSTGGWAGALFLLGYGGWRARQGRWRWTRRRPARQTVDASVRFLQGALGRVERRLARTGHVREGHETLVEFAGRAQDEVLNRLVAVYCDVRYGAVPLTAEAKANLERMR
ncbi:MAG TPA: transglutaminase domain-containing protein [Candidatus Xenobia bacterium]|jgi:hypothetical protein